MNISAARGVAGRRTPVSLSIISDEDMLVHTQSMKFIGTNIWKMNKYTHESMYWCMLCLDNNNTNQIS